MLPLIVEGTNILEHNITPTGEELAMCQHMVLSSYHEWNPHSVNFCKALRSVEEDIDYRRSILSIISAILYDNNDEDDDI